MNWSHVSSQLSYFRHLTGPSGLGRHVYTHDIINSHKRTTFNIEENENTVDTNRPISVSFFLYYRYIVPINEI